MRFVRVVIWWVLVFGAAAWGQVPDVPPPSAVTANDETRPAPPKGRPTLPPEKANPVMIPRFAEAPVIDGRLDEPVWQTAARLKDFYQTQPGDNIAPSQQTEVLIGYDARTLYLAFIAHDTGQVRVTVPKRDEIFNDDNVRVLLDTFNDKRRAYILAFNPLGVQADGILTEGGGEDYSLDIVMESKGEINEKGYIVEVAVPFKSLRYEAGRGKRWGVHLFRRIKRNDNELNSWMPISRDRGDMLGQSGSITGIEDLSTERTLELIPTLTVLQSGRRVATLPRAVVVANPGLLDPGRFVNSPARFDPGLSLKYTLTPNIVLDFAANPDFAQVEADAPVVTANQRFPIFFAERRPFFLEGIDIFQTPLNAVHTRAIIDPDYAVKISGKQGRNTFGVLLASDNAPGNFSEDERNDPDLRPEIEPFLDKNAYVGVLRLKRDIGRYSELGFLATSYNFIEKHNQLAGFDGRFRIDPQTIFRFQALGTTSRRLFYDPELDQTLYRTGNALAYYWEFDYTGRNIGWFLSGEGRTRDYRADVGFTQRTDTNRQNAYFRVSSDPKPGGALLGWRLTTFNGLNYDFRGRAQARVHEVEMQWNFARQTNLGAGWNSEYNRIFEEEFGPIRTAARQGAFFGPDAERSTFGNGFFAWGDSAPSRTYRFGFSTGRSWGALDFDFGAGPRFPRVSPAALADPHAPLDPGAAMFWNVNLWGVYQPTDALQVSLDYRRAEMTRRDTGLRMFVADLATVRGTYQFTRFTFARLRLDYDTLSSTLRGQYLLGWTPNPGTSFYLGYNDDMNFNGFNPFTGHLEPGLRRTGRTFFIKASYLIRRSM